jgi:hypothetical protein
VWKRDGEGLSDRLVEGTKSLEVDLDNVGMHDMVRGWVCMQG